MLLGPLSTPLLPAWHRIPTWLANQISIDQGLNVHMVRQLAEKMAAESTDE